ncbi:MAG TPA: carbohydrate-binding family 9-like protein [Pyrinomonadaceae bacterium]|nr:carbohydrate-binding family 9-like protein [Pyrinomonadaceae bacterium]
MADDQTIEALHTEHDLGLSDFANHEWDHAPSITVARYWSGTPAPASRHFEARLLWSDAALHVRYTCNQAEPLIVSDTPQTEKKTMGLWDRDVCEIFLAPDPNAVENYFEIEAAPTGEWMDLAIEWRPEGRVSDWDFDSQMTTAAQTESDRVTLAMRIPWSKQLPQPQPGDRWRVNLFRCVGKDPNRGYLAWQPTKLPQPGFHLPQVFGWLRFR